MDHQWRNFYAELGRRVRKYRALKGLTQDTLARVVGLSRPSIANIERGHQMIPIDRLVSIAAALSVSTDQLLPIEWEKDPNWITKATEHLDEDTRDWIRTAVKNPLPATAQRKDR